MFYEEGTVSHVQCAAEFSGPTAKADKRYPYSGTSLDEMGY